MSAYSPVPADTAEAARYLQDRVARLGAAVLLMALVMGIASIATHVPPAGAGTEGGGLAHEILHLASLLPALAVWLLCRGRQMSTAVVEVMDAGLTIAACFLYALLGMSASSSLSVALSVPLAMTYTLLGRSIIVPSSSVRTLLISAASAVPTIVYFHTQGVSETFGHSPEGGRVFVLFGTLWCAFAVFAAAANSRQLYGLRARIREIGKLGQYTLEKKIGEGGMGAVYRATHAMLRRPAAIKLLAKAGASERDQARFEREVQLTSTLTHPNTVAIFDYGRTADGVFYYVMEYLDGLDLERLVREHGPLEPARVIHILVQVCGALVEAHALQLIHRDIKPANIVLTERVDEPDVVKVVDFGLVKTLATDGAESRSDTITGTPLYLSPEAIQAPEAVDARADIYALGAVAYFLLAGRDVFKGETVVEVLSRHLLEEPQPPSAYAQRALPADLERLVLQCLAKAPDARPASAAALRSALLACEDASRYDRQAASAWWLAHRPELHTGEARVATGSPATMAVDLRGRSLSGSGESVDSLTLALAAGRDAAVVCSRCQALSPPPVTGGARVRRSRARRRVRGCVLHRYLLAVGPLTGRSVATTVMWAEGCTAASHSRCAYRKIDVEWPPRTHAPPEPPRQRCDVTRRTAVFLALCAPAVGGGLQLTVRRAPCPRRSAQGNGPRARSARGDEGRHHQF